MRWLAALAALWPMAVAAHPIEPLVTSSPMPVPEDQIDVDSTYQALHGQGHTDHGVQLGVTAGIGPRAEISVGGGVDATEATIGPIVVGAKVLLVMEGHAPLDLALAASVTSGQSGVAALLLGRSVAPGFYLQGKVALLGSSAEADTVAATPAKLPHTVDEGVAGKSVSLQAAAALQWSPAPRFLPTLEAQATHSFAAGGGDDVWIVPEMMFLLDMNHLSVKVGVPIGLAGELDVGVIAALDWQG